MNLMPLYIYREHKADKLEKCIKLNAEDCTECGCCAYICPARIPLVSVLREVKQKALAEKEAEINENR